MALSIQIKQIILTIIQLNILNIKFHKRYKLQYLNKAYANKIMLACIFIQCALNLQFDNKLFKQRQIGLKINNSNLFRISSSANMTAFNIPRISLAFAVTVGMFLLTTDCITGSNISCAEISYYNCDMCYNYIAPNENSSEPVVFFSSCSRTICTNRTCRRVAGKYRCSCKQYKDVQLNQTKCLNTCCEGLGLTQFSQDALNQCQANSQRKQQQLKAILIGSLVGGIGGLIIIIILCVWCCRIRSKKK